MDEVESIDTLLRKVAATERTAVIGAPPTIVGRYRVGARLGSGGLGLVHVAWDAVLGRDVALKFVRPDRASAAADDHLQVRLRREARALAQLAHPNVVPVFDVGEADGQVYIVMQKLEGRTLRRWLHEAPRALTEVIEVFRQAGEGLAAAHRVSVVHRDFKPENVLVDARGRAVVVDFGLARAAERYDSAITDELPASEPTQRGSSRLTETGTVMGTRGYIAPELLRGEEATAQSDQYAFCVALREAVVGEHPRWLQSILARGLDPDPARRWPSMRDLLDALAAKRSPRRRSKAIAVAIAAVAAGAAWWAAGDPPRSCDEEAENVSSVWSEPVQQRLRAALTESTSGDTALHDRLAGQIDHRAAALRDAFHEVCRAKDTLEPRAWSAAEDCLHAHRDELAALLDVLADAPTQESVHNAIAAIPELRSPTICADERWLPRDRTAQDPKRQADVRRRLWHARALRIAGRYPEALVQAQLTADVAEAMLRATALVEVGRLRNETGELQRAEQALEQAYYLAVENGVDDVALDAATLLVHLVGHELRRDGDAMRWASLAESILARLELRGEVAEAALLGEVGMVHRDFGRIDLASDAHERALGIVRLASTSALPLEATLHAYLGTTRHAQGRYAEAEQEHARAVELRRELLGPDHPAVATALGDLGIMQGAQHDYAAAEQSYATGLAIAERSLGRDHVATARLSHQLATVLMVQGRYPEAAERFSNALAVFEQTLGAEHPDVASVLHALAHAHRSMRRFDEAEKAATRALTLLEQQLGAEHAAVATALGGLATIHLESDRPDQARPLLERALAIREQKLPPEHPEIGGALTNLGNARLALGEVEQAERDYDRAIAIFEKANGPDASVLAYPLWSRAKAREAQGRIDEALQDAERALSLRQTEHVADWERAESQQQVAVLLVAAGLQRERALSLAREALQTFVDNGEATATQRAELEAWFARVEPRARRAAGAGP